jgi:hypothetical protein
MFGSVDGNGQFDLWDLNTNTEVSDRREWEESRECND